MVKVVPSSIFKQMRAKIRGFWSDFSDKEVRDEFVSAHLGSRLASQVYAMRRQRGLTQAQLASAISTGQSRISLLEESCEDVSLNTLKKLASAFDVALMVRFVPFSTLLRSAVDPAADEVDIPSFPQDVAPALEQRQSEPLPSTVPPGSRDWLNERRPQWADAQRGTQPPFGERKSFDPLTAAASGSRLDRPQLAMDPQPVH